MFRYKQDCKLYGKGCVEENIKKNWVITYICTEMSSLSSGFAKLDVTET